jgi:hypothetical protein
MKIWEEKQVRYMRNPGHFSSYLAQLSLEWEMFHINFFEKIESHILHSTTFLENRDVYKLMWKNIADLDRPQIKIWHMRVAQVKQSANIQIAHLPT